MIKMPRFETDGGSYGIYFELSASVGLKVIRTAKDFPTVAKAVSSRTFKRAQKEAELLDLAFETGVVPRCYGITIVKARRGYAVGILMQHLGHQTVEEAQESEAYDFITDALAEHGIKHKDLHRNNIMVYRGKFYAVDFDSRFVRVK